MNTWNRPTVRLQRHGYLLAALALSCLGAALPPAAFAAARAKATPAPHAAATAPADRLFASGFEAPHQSLIDMDSLLPADGEVLSSGLAVTVGLDFTSRQDPLPNPLQLEVDGKDYSAGLDIGNDHIENNHLYKMAPGLHHVVARVGQDVAEWSFITVPAPEILSFVPTDPVLPAGSQPQIEARFRDLNSSLAASGVRLHFDGRDVTAQSQIVMTDAHAGLIRYTPPGPLAQGEHIAHLMVTNAIDATQLDALFFHVDTPELYDIEFVAPAGAQHVQTDSLDVMVRVSSNRHRATAVTVNGRSTFAVSFDGDFCAYRRTLRLQPGKNIIEATATFDDGQLRHATLEVVYDVAARVGT